MSQSDPMVPAEAETRVLGAMDQHIDSDQWRQLKEILDRVAEEPVDQWPTLAADLCGGDDRLFAEVMSFLELDHELGDFISDPLWRVLPEEEKADAVDGRIGPYRLTRRLGQGGMGEVFLAVRQDDYQQEVALKRTLEPVLREELRGRFVTERQILADLQHPGIARLLDGGTDEVGRPYLVMEYVDGLPIDDFCDQNDLKLRQRLRLMSKVCRIVHHAHQNLVVHRDLKPSNILVTAAGQPRLLDFGIAKLLRPDADATAREMAVLTPACASPEQIMGETITTACDVYALGVLLFRLLTDRQPYRLTGLSFPVVRRIVCLQEVEKPSLAVLGDAPTPRHPDTAVDSPLGEATTFSDQRPAREPADLRKRSRQLRGDLDSIVLKALRKEPEHRFGSAAEMADDIDRYLAGLPVEARRGSWFYQLGKHLRRNKPIVALMALIFMLAVISTILGWQAEKARRAAVEARDESESLQGTLIGILKSPAPDEAKGRDRTVREVIEESRPVIMQDLAGRPRLQAEMFEILGQVFDQLNDPEKALDLYLEALAKQREHDPSANAGLADDIANVGSAYYSLGQFGRAAEAYREAYTMHEKLGNEAQAALTLYNLTNVRMRNGETNGVAEAFHRVLEIRQRSGAPASEIADTLYSLGTWSIRRGDFPEAVTHLEEALRLRREGADGPSTGVAAVAKTLARAYHAVGRLAESQDLYEESMAILEFLLEEEHSKLFHLRLHMARLYIDRGQADEAHALARESLEQAEARWPENHANVITARSVNAASLAALGQKSEDNLALIWQGFETLRSKQGSKAFVTQWTRRHAKRPRGSLPSSTGV